MADAAKIGAEEIARLEAFHATHFPNQAIPNLSSPNTNHVAPNEDNDDDDGLGYYPDGVKRTLTDDQIKMFRHSEIQRLLSERRQAREAAEEAVEQAARREEDRARKRVFFDDVAQRQDSVQDLSYDDPPLEPEGAGVGKEKRFMWPKLGV